MIWGDLKNNLNIIKLKILQKFDKALRTVDP